MIPISRRAAAVQPFLAMDVMAAAAAKARAVLQGRTHGTAEDVRRVAHAVLRHRLIPNFNAEADQVSTDAIIQGMLDEIPLGEASPDQRRQMDAVLE